MIMENQALVAETAKQLCERRPLRYLEIGVNEAGSALAVLEACPSIHIAVLVDTWGKEAGGTNQGSSLRAKEVLKDYLGACLFITGSSHAVLPTLDYQFDLIFVDGDHSPEGAWSDMINSKRLLSPLGVMIVDDTCHPQHSYIKGIVDTFARDYKFKVEHHDKAHMGVAILR